MSDKHSDDEDFFTSFKKAFNEERNKVEDKDTPLKDQIIEGFTVGVTETLFHPVRWLRTFIKKD